MDGAPDSGGEDWGLFGRPLFDDPTSRRLSRVGVVDIGSNSVRLVIFDGAARSPAYFYNEKVLCGLGAGMAETRRLNPEGKHRAMAAFRRFQALAEGFGISPLTAVATAAMREAEDGPEFQAQIETETGMSIFVVDGQDEARLSAQGVLLGWPAATGLVCDIGGSSMEFAMLEDGVVGERGTYPLGPLKLQSAKHGKGALRKMIDHETAVIGKHFSKAARRLYLVGGSWRAIAKVDMARRNYPLKVLHEYRPPPGDLKRTLKWIGNTDQATLRHLTGISSGRMSLIPSASLVLDSVLRALKPKEIFVSSYGLREGLLWEQMPQTLRERDPLIEACRFAEAKDARVPGFGKVLFSFVKPLFPRFSKSRLRLVKAACLLHDVSWRAHPDYRAEVCFDYATRANLGGLSHSDRVFLGLALLHRYKNSRAEQLNPMLDLIEKTQQREAEILGKALRFGSMFSAQQSDQMGRLLWRRGHKQLVLHLNSETRALFGEPAQARFESLGKALHADTMVVSTAAE
ncbi:MAG: Ppx/GppA family phosphatase [Pseudomonadota bacterium]